MKHYTSQIPQPLGEKLKEKGMPIEEDIYLEDDGYWDKTIKSPSYAEVFDWLLGEQIYVRIITFGASRIGEETWDWSFYIDQLGEPSTETDFFWHTWHEAADAAIEKALTLL